MDDLRGQGSPPSLINASLPVYNKVLSALLHTAPLDNPRRAFMVEFMHDRLLLENVVIVAGKAGMQLQVFGILWQRFLEDLATGLMPDDFRIISVSELTDIIDNGSQGDAIDDLNVRRAINRLQLDLMETVRRNLGWPIEREDIIQNLRADGKRRKRNGYRINPSMVLPKATSCS
ncbi:MAG: hypothetical protein HQM03_11335 [Magnetococcales bacterium]|nr:hypothetical protein [Magnetococcales bacterium]